MNIIPMDEEIFGRLCDVFSGIEYALAKHDFHYGIRVAKIKTEKALINFESCGIMAQEND